MFTLRKLFLDPLRTALILIDLHNDLLSEGGFYYREGWPISGLRSILPGLAGLRRSLPEQLRVVYTARSYDPNGGDASSYRRVIIPPHLQTLEGITADGLSLLAGSWGAEIVDELRPLPGDPLVACKGLDAFFGSDLEQILNGWDVNTVVLGGVITELAVESTARSAFERGFEVLILSDGTASWEPERHFNSLRNLEFGFGMVVESSQLLRMLPSGRKDPDRRG
ncbi:MAG: cysteine hydrolase [Firmicutes bacterium]|nr:cysteine hydrolase [Bacillota bacterium]